MSGDEVRLVRGDCAEVMEREVAPASVDLVFADPPYNLSGRSLKCEGNTTGGDWHKMDEGWDHVPADRYRAFTERWIRAARRVLTPTGSIYVCCTYHNLSDVLSALSAAGFRLNDLITWYKSNAMPNMTHRTFTHACEFLAWAVAGKGWTFNYRELKALNPERQKDGSEKQMRDLWVLPLCQGAERLRGRDRRALHPTQKPEALVERAVVASSRPGDLVLDPFLGSGTTAVVARRLGRRCVGIERERRYLEAAEERLRRLFPDDRDAP